MDEEKPNPLTTHLLNMVEGRQQAEIAKLTILTELLTELKQTKELVARVEEQITELLERSRER